MLFCLLFVFFLLIPSAQAVDYRKCDVINNLIEKAVKEDVEEGKRLVKSLNLKKEKLGRTSSSKQSKRQYQQIHDQ